MDYLKTRAPFWKKEVFANGKARWVEAHESDDAAADGLEIFRKISPICRVSEGAEIP